MTCLCSISCIAPWKPEKRDRLWVPPSHVFVARNWNFAISGWPLTASRVANSVAVSTPLVRGFSVVMLMLCSLSVGCRRFRRRLVVLCTVAGGGHDRVPPHDGGAVENRGAGLVGDPGGQGRDRLVRTDGGDSGLRR